MNRPVSSPALIRPWRVLVCGVGVAVLVGCAAPLHKAPVEDRVGARPVPPAPSAAVPAPPEPAKLPAGSENAAKPGYYTVKPGDTMIRIGLETGQNWRDIARWNGIENPNVLEVGQVLRVAPPGVDPSAPTPRGVTAGRVEPRPLDVRPAIGAAAPASAPAPTAAVAAAPREADDDIAWAWPAAAGVVVPFDEARSKGLVLAGKAGDPVLAAADGRVVYAGSGLRGYGNLVIVKHNGTYLSAYAHNQTLLVKEDQVVRRGQKIAEMGSSDADRVQLHFEIRRLGKPVDPARLLPAR